ncbi:hypothetical protein MVES1_002608 [Malassezia vespertilionis]|uniref:uncharacterized protein n=1 Tax=Malassezia vespertilionis TaxID=2020962 RepID=UPI0024B06727|nr:uncharacterized protein MVES1_002608 [Malassezia vespertilionis]WFD07248.1 hypothetical protein MVES1_002608 [Malassezia vespertilionis]
MRDECKAQVLGYPNSVFKSFAVYDEAVAFSQGASSHSAKRKISDAAVPAQKLARIEAPFDGLTVYTDGSSRGNGRLGARAGYGVYWDDPEYHHLNVSRRLDGEVQTNNRAELTAILTAVEACPVPSKPLRIFTDSQYALNGTTVYTLTPAITKWMPQWRKNNWKTSTGSQVQNKALLLALDAAFLARPVRPLLVHVRAHAGTRGNEMADALANKGAMLPATDGQ